MIYLASPYSDEDPHVKEGRFYQACKAVVKLMFKGEVVFSPIVHSHPLALRFSLPGGWDFWEQYDRQFIQMCERVIVLMLPGWDQSKGVAAEVAIAKELGKPVEYLEP